ncbi:hypothetical protein MN116_003944 [Schistosoma mekongi]|uniref:LIM zinc-binding domain-containing protein n=1 Tax=Schistosoma mekongi TaxID=38744 RepID=A0AAE2D5Z0_SCHME|nr:hypothetical protein MN116_003944 [Schistosoma mekongi]
MSSTMMCAKCARPFTSGSILSALDKKWHPECFVCTICKRTLADQSFHVRNDDPYCANCLKENFQPRCATCRNIIDPSEQYMTYNEKAYHKNCFTCAACHQSLAGKQFCIKDNGYYCPEHV